MRGVSLRLAFSGIDQSIESLAQLFFRGVIHRIKYLHLAILERKFQCPKNQPGKILSKIDTDKALQVEGTISNTQGRIHNHAEMTARSMPARGRLPLLRSGWRRGKQRGQAIPLRREPTSVREKAMRVWRQPARVRQKPTSVSRKP